MLPKEKSATNQLELDLNPPDQYELFESSETLEVESVGDITISLNDVMSDPSWYTTGTMANTTYTIDTTSTITLGSAITEDFSRSENFQHLQEQLDAINERLAILQPNPEHLEKYEALREAYEHYKTLERLVKNG